MHKPIVASLVAALAVVHAPRPAHACSPLESFPHELDPAFADDTTPPDVTLTGDATIIRREDDEMGCNEKCGGGRYAAIDVPLVATDDRTTDLGWELTLQSGTLPAGLVLPLVPMNGIDLQFDPDAHGFDFTLAIRAVDLNGNRSAPILVEVHDVDDEGGCAAAGATRPVGTVLIGLALLVSLRRRRAARR